MTEARLRGQEYLLERRLFRRRSTGEVIERDRKARRWTRFAFPTWWHYDVLRGLEYLRSAGVTPDERVAEAIELVASKRDGDGRWPLETRYPGAMPVEMDEGVGRPSRWNTLRALRVLGWYSPRLNRDSLDSRLRCEGEGLRPAPAAVRSRPRMRQTSNAEAAPKSAWGVQAQRRRAQHVAQHRPGPRASADTSPPLAFDGLRRAGRGSRAQPFAVVKLDAGLRRLQRPASEHPDHVPPVLFGGVQVDVDLLQAVSGDPGGSLNGLARDPLPDRADSTLARRWAWPAGAGDSDARRATRPSIHFQHRGHTDEGVVRGALVQLGVAAAFRAGANCTAAMISSSARSTVKRSWKKSPHFTARQPPGPLMCTSALRATITAG